MPNTETVGAGLLRDSGWTIMPWNAVTSVMDRPPEVAYHLHDAEPFAGGLVGSYRIMPTPTRRSISPLTHRILLERSLEEYGEIWTSLADR